MTELDTQFDDKICTVVVEYEDENGMGEAYEVDSAEEGSKELEEIVATAKAGADSWVHELHAEWAIVLVGHGHDVETVNVETAEVIYKVERDGKND